ncbi:sulfotransferase [Stieleria sp. TO1_6]|uniref:sulfotransferase n=1 Tax=Stieleria tagensis TaxID=2956795 RepID=UPI00209B9D5F|nr:sulfotransferase domain-containing protein [Stieleria tagensis]MCO8122492.1 sulfotransferase [Stieleria tagensis]
MNRLQGDEHVYVTKRGFGWYQQELLDLFCEEALAGGYGVIYMVRDPADVLTSRHRGDSSTQYYLSPDRWVESVRGGEHLVSQLDGRVPFLTIRYEDLVTDPEATRQQIESCFDMQLRSEVTSWSDLGENVDAGALGDLATALHSIRSFDADSIGKWKRTESLADYWEGLLCGEFGDELLQFGQRYQYDSTKIVAGS